MLTPTVTSNVEVNRQQLHSESDPFTLDRYRQFARHLSGTKLRVLDCGCNTGRGGKILQQTLQNPELYGIDLIEERIDQISPGLYQNLVAASSVNLPFEDGFFDAIVAGEFIEHVNDPDLLATFQEFKRVLKPSGKILLTTPNPKSMMVMLGRTHIFDEPSHVNIMAPGLLKEKLAKGGLKLAKVVGSGKASRYVGENFPYFNVYGSYLAIVTH